jgi:hypothetical protein
MMSGRGDEEMENGSRKMCRWSAHGASFSGLSVTACKLRNMQPTTYNSMKDHL